MCCDGVLNCLDCNVRGIAESQLAASAEEVEVDASLADGSVEDHSVLLAPAVAGTAPEAALEVVQVDSVSLTCGSLAVEDRLDAVEQLSVDECFVAPRELFAVICHVAEVVAVSQHRGELGVGHRAGGVAARTSLQAAIGEFVDEGFEQGIAITKLRECPVLLRLLKSKLGPRATDDEALRKAEDVLKYAVDQLATDRARKCVSAALNFDHVDKNLGERRSLLRPSVNRISPRQMENIENAAFAELGSILQSLTREEVARASSLTRRTMGTGASKTPDASFRNLAIDSVVTVLPDGRLNYIDLIDIEFLLDDVEVVETWLRPSPADNSRPEIHTEALRGFSVEETISNGDVFMQTWRFPRSFKAGERHSIAQSVSTSHPVKPYYAYAPAAKPIDHLRLQLTFKDWRPLTVSVLEGVQTLKLGDGDLSLFGEPIELDAMGSCEVEFDQLSPGFVNGVCWSAPGVPA